MSFAEKGPEINTDIEQVAVDNAEQEDQNEVFKAHVNGENYRTVSWYSSFALMFKVLFSVGVLSIPGVFAYVGALPGALLVIGWGLYNTYAAFILGAFRLRHPGMHGLQDMAYIVGGAWYRELVGVLYVIGYTLVTGSGYIGTATAFNALSEHGACTVWFSFVAFVISTAVAAFPKFGQIGVVAWVGVTLLYVAVLILTIAVGAQDRPFLAPEGVTDYGYQVVASNTTFITGMSACLIIFVSSSGTSAFIPIIAEMRNPKEYKKPIAAAMGLLNVTYLVVALVVYRYCGIYIASPALGSAGTLIKKLTYGIGLPGLLVSAILCQHLAAKYFFVRILRGTEHLQTKTKTHWITWLGSVILIGIISFVVAEAIPFFSTLIGLVGALAYAPLAIIVPMTLWLYDFGNYRKGNVAKKSLWFFHVLFIFIGLFMTVGGSYTMIQTIIDAYATGSVDRAFSCADK
ncbi:uncharacterized protein I303_104849 [Kwoniella dejecticola CBS 10117]|uniref:Amino acid transporter transmembrane domain-containing protein n=1 Tax=Kwoniella dejecticola CBS 10117 TaxID=1296121 RepID=A0A1A6A467_9TREE|nr:uncharacterized protein I303_04168 [Kwoniella dejecticola CBS 10117]OBR84847.1 hypothetical protein I303_04168 [Kwoniella dejecticola CBS 10117]